MNCPICSARSNLIFRDFPGYVEGTKFDIFHCPRCDTQFINAPTMNSELYELIYKNENASGYDRYLVYANEIKKRKNKLKYLSEAESTYFPIYQFLKNKSNQEILEVGCGYGYLTYGLNSIGHNAVGIDISRRAIEYAKSHFGDRYFISDLKDYQSDRKYDLIIAIELIEHLNNPVEFISLCSKLLKGNGKIIITTRNKDFKRNEIWQTDSPPVHTVWLSKKSFECIADKENLDLGFIDFTRHVAKDENQLVDHLLRRASKQARTKLPLPRLDRKGKPCKKGADASDSLLRRIIHRILFSMPVIHICNLTNHLISREYKTLGVVLRKR